MKRFKELFVAAKNRVPKDVQSTLINAVDLLFAGILVGGGATLGATAVIIALF